MYGIVLDLIEKKIIMRKKITALFYLTFKNEKKNTFLISVLFFFFCNKKWLKKL